MSNSHSRSIKPFEIIEVIFDISYLCFVLGATIYFNRQYHPYGWYCLTMSGLLFLGDSCHLLPRIAAILTKDKQRFFQAMQFGKMITSITMSFFYVALYMLWNEYYATYWIPEWVTILFYGALLLRLLFSVYPMKQWYKNPEAKYVYWRNLPFLIMGGIVFGLFFVSFMQSKDSYTYMFIAILFSFGFYIPVALWADKKPALGALMLPKTLMYVWMITMLFSL